MKEKEQLRKEFDKRVKTLNMDKEAKEELFTKFLNSWNDGFKCVYCNNKMDLKYENEYGWTIDHVIPRAKNGKDEVSNLEFICRDCNFQKKALDAEEYRTKMEKIKSRKKNREIWKARKASKKEEREREAFKDIFQHINAKKEMEK